MVMSLSLSFAIDASSKKIIDYARHNSLITDNEYKSLQGIPLELNKKEKLCVWDDMQKGTVLMDAITDCRGI